MKTIVSNKSVSFNAKLFAFFGNLNKNIFFYFYLLEFNKIVNCFLFKVRHKVFSKNLIEVNKIGKTMLQIVFLTFFFSSSLYSQVFQSWVKRYVGSLTYGRDEVFSLKIDNSGNPIITGLSQFYSSTNFECPVIKYNRCAGNSTIDIIHNFQHGNSDIGKDLTVDNSDNIYMTGSTSVSALGYYDDILYGKYNSSLSRIFLNRYGGLGIQTGNKVKTDAQGNIYVGGFTVPGLGLNWEFYLCKFNSNGSYLWERTYNNGIANLDHEIIDMSIDPNGYIYVTGKSFGNGSGLDIATLKYDLNGNLLWTNRYNGNGNSGDVPFSMALDNQGYIYVGGVSWQEEHPTEGASGARNTFTVIKYNPSNGKRLWVKYFYGTSVDRNSQCLSIATDDNCNVICTGYAKMNNSDYDYVTMKCYPSGGTMWLKQYDNGNTEDYANSVGLDGLGNVYVTGRSRPQSGPNSPSDFATLKYSASSGNQEWIKRYNGPDNGPDIGKYIVVNGNNDLYVSGLSYGNLTEYDFLTIRYYNSWFSCTDEDNPTNDDIYDICFIDSNKMFGVTDAGSIIKSNDHGLTWNEAANIGQHRLNAVKFLNSNIGIAAGNSGKIFYTSNGGNNWINKTLSSNKDINDICFTDNGNIFLCGEKGLVIKASNYSGSFSVKYLDTNVSLKSVKFVNSNTGFATGTSGTIYKTTNNGNAWNRIQLNSNYNFNKIAKDFNNNMFIVGKNGICLRSSNNGNNWQSLNTNVNVNLNDLFVKDSTSLYAAGDRGTILFSSDKGNTWEKQITERTENLHSIKFNNNDIGIASGDDNVFLRSSLGESTDYSPTDNSISLMTDSKEKVEPNSSYLKENYPNPFNPSTQISYFLSTSSNVEISVYDISGKLIQILENGNKDAGINSVTFNASNLSSGIYFYRINAYEPSGLKLIFTETKRMILLK